MICLTGFIRRAEAIGFIQRGTHRLVDRSGNVVAILRGDQVNLFALEGRLALVCGIDEGMIEGFRSVLVRRVLA
jgi:hypothetical protein